MNAYQTSQVLAAAVHATMMPTNMTNSSPLNNSSRTAANKACNPPTALLRSPQLSAVVEVPSAAPRIEANKASESSVRRFVPSPMVNKQRAAMDEEELTIDKLLRMGYSLNDVATARSRRSIQSRLCAASESKVMSTIHATLKAQSSACKTASESMATRTRTRATTAVSSSVSSSRTTPIPTPSGSSISRKRNSGEIMVHDQHQHRPSSPPSPTTSTVTVTSAASASCSAFQSSSPQKRRRHHQSSEEVQNGGASSPLSILPTPLPLSPPLSPMMSMMMPSSHFVTAFSRYAVKRQQQHQAILFPSGTTMMMNAATTTAPMMMVPSSAAMTTTASAATFQW